SMHPRPQSSPLFPYTTLFRSSFGTLLQPGPPKRIRIHQPGMPPIEGELSQRVLHVAGEICQNRYVVDQKKSVPGKRIVLRQRPQDRKSTRLNSSHVSNSYAVF